jgi:hypothetical protein
MRIRLAAVVATLCLVAAAGAQAPPPGAPPPRLAVEPASFDFGKALPGKALTREFILRNLGGAELTVLGVSTTCGCTVAQGYASVVKPGESTSMQVTLRTPAVAGRVSKSVLVRTNDPATPTTEIRIEATVTAPAVTGTAGAAAAPAGAVDSPVAPVRAPTAGAPAAAGRPPAPPTPGTAAGAPGRPPKPGTGPTPAPPPPTPSPR